MPARVRRMIAGVGVVAERDRRHDEMRQVSPPEIGSQRKVTPNSDDEQQREPEGRHRLADHGDGEASAGRSSYWGGSRRCTPSGIESAEREGERHGAEDERGRQPLRHDPADRRCGSRTTRRNRRAARGRASRDTGRRAAGRSRTACGWLDVLGARAFARHRGRDVGRELHQQEADRPRPSGPPAGRAGRAWR